MPTKQIHLEVPAKQYRFVMKLLQSLPFLRVQPESPVAADSEQAIYNNVAQGFSELELVRKGKLQARPIQDILDELANRAPAELVN